VAPDLSTVAAVRDAYAQGASAADVIDAALARVAASPDPAPWISLRPRDELLAEARALDPSRRAALPLWGVPFAVKDNIDCAGLPTTCAFPPRAAAVAARDAFVVARLRAAGAIPLGKTNLDQFATGLVGVRSPYGIPRCVFDAEYVSGGSSSGSAVTVARGHVPFALGTDTAGSGRVPAAFNHLVGVKPTRGLLSTSGVVPASRSLDCVSVFAASVAEADLVRRAAQGFDADDPYARTADAVHGLPVARATLGVLASADRDFFGDADAAALYAHAVETAVRLGHALREVDYAPFREAARLLYGGAWVAERLAALETVLDADPGALDPVVRSILEDARRHGGADAFRACEQLAVLRRRADAAWAGVDALLLPTAPTIYRVADVLADPVRRNANLGTYTNFVNLLDCCAVAVPAGFGPQGLPFGVTLVAPAFSDDDLALLADDLHRALEPTFGLGRAPLPWERPPGAAAPGTVDLAVVGAHLGGEPLNHQLVERGATLVAATRTAPDYRLFALAGTVPPKPGLVREPGFAGPGIAVEVWRVSSARFGDFVAAVPPPLAIGSVVLADGRVVKGFVCEPFATAGALDITAHGGWRAWRRSRGD
jgi:allophanate hydrolase